MQFKNPNHTTDAEARYTKYAPYIAEFINQLPTEQAGFTFDDIRAYFSAHPEPAIAALVPEMTDGVLDDLCQRHGLERA